MNSMAVNVFIMSASSVASNVSAKALSDEDSKLKFSQLLGSLSQFDDPPAEEKEEPNPVDLFGAVEAVLRAELIIEAELEDLPKEWQEDFAFAWASTIDDATLRASDWSEEKKLAFLVISYSEGDSATKDLIKQKVPEELFEKLERGIEHIVPLLFMNDQKDSTNQKLLNQLNLTEFIFSNKENESKSSFLLGHNGKFENYKNHTRMNVVQNIEQKQAVVLKEGMTLVSEAFNSQSLEERLSKPEPLQLYIGERLPKEMQQQQFLRQLHSILKRGTFTQTPQGFQTLSIKIYPEHLGRLNIQLTQQEGMITARIIAGTSATRELVETQLQQLRQAFVQQQIQVDRIEVTHEQYPEQQKEDESKKDAREEHADKNDSEDSVLFQEVLDEVFINEQI
ncbi:flagellar hook-length control protein FliK [Halalkalibacter alkaliphilus]|uniref:Flagellar hook-length control protein FliK n=1 Tax=Halalkalibacter alkaliphilus TaxID=2917993 RepID=A0A9X2A0H3_9BACI|nr:flagellar hook-length control protein FliK [Halalkalibacter alkaliphilus]MCL7746470.1 flagellar hook-length control protein FliK [Halalkalibacter alkaliphilus]